MSYVPSNNSFEVFNTLQQHPRVSFRNPVVQTASPVPLRQTTPYPVAEQFFSAATASVPVGRPVVPPSAPSQVEESIYRSVNPLPLGGADVVTVNGQTGLWTNKHENDNWRGELPINQYAISQDPCPTVVRKKPEQKVLYNQDVAVRYLKPPTPPPPGDIVVREQPNIPTGPAPPIVLRQQPPRPTTPPALIVREAPPQPPCPVPPVVVTVPGKRIPPPPRKVVVERLPQLPSKPQSIFVERWLPYDEQPRRVVYERNQVPDPVVPVPKNVLVQWESPDVVVRKDFRDLGVVRANPVEYINQHGASLRQPHELPTFVRDIRPPAGVVLAAEHRPASVTPLVGDVQALNLVDLDRIGLSQYRRFVGGYSSCAQPAAVFARPAPVPSSFVQCGPEAVYGGLSPIPVPGSFVQSAPGSFVQAQQYYDQGSFVQAAQYGSAVPCQF